MCLTTSVHLDLLHRKHGRSLLREMRELRHGRHEQPVKLVKIEPGVMDADNVDRCMSYQGHMIR